MSASPPSSGEQLRDAYLRFFQERGHRIVPSSSLIPGGDPTLLLTSAGMVQFKPYFIGDEVPENPRMASVQKCFRTTDIDQVGDLTHHTFFEMLGNFSIGDYFKREAIAWAWEFTTGVLQLPPERLWITIYLDDEEAHDIWRDEIGVPEGRIIRLGEKDNFWGPAGTEGPCGPCSELHYDHGESHAPGAVPGDDGADGRFVEIWNLVFVQFYQDSSGERTLLSAPGIDTGMGLERVAAIVQAKPSAYETDLLAPVVRRVEQLSAKPYGTEDNVDHAIRVVAEHARAATFLLADGVVPSNEGRGYVLRRVIRRGIRFGRTLGMGADTPFMEQTAQAVVERMAAAYPELTERRSYVLQSIAQEERAFGALLDGADSYIADTVKEVRASGGGDTIPGRAAFNLYDRYGLPLDLTQEIAAEHGLSVDVEGFEREMEAQRERSRAAAGFAAGRETARLFDGAGDSVFTGYDALTTETVIAALLKDGAPVGAASEGDGVALVLRETPFYPEGGGQVGDTGAIEGDGFRISVGDTHRPTPNAIIHDATVDSGTVRAGDRVTARVDGARRADLMRNHTGTHMLHAVLRRILGSHVRQMGSLVAPDRLRFDFSHTAPVSPEQLSEIQQVMNEAVRADLSCSKGEGGYHEVIAAGALAFFGDRYPERVRTLCIGDSDAPFSYEVCAGTHLKRTGEVGHFRIVSESGLGTGIRRIEAVTGRGADAWVDRQVALLGDVAAKVGVAPADVSRRVDTLLQEADEARRAGAAARRQTSLQQAEELLAGARQVGGVNLVVSQADAASADTLREMGDWLRDKLGSGIVVLGTVLDGRPFLVAMVTKDLVARGHSAGDIVKAAASRMGGGGGGRPDVAQAGGREPGMLPEAFAAAVQAVESHAT